MALLDLQNMKPETPTTPAKKGGGSKGSRGCAPSTLSVALC